MVYVFLQLYFQASTLIFLVLSVPHRYSCVCVRYQTDVLCCFRSIQYFFATATAYQEHGAGIEPANNGFADRSHTT